MRNDPINPEDFIHARDAESVDAALVGNQDGIKDGIGPAPSIVDDSKSPYPGHAKEKRLREEASVPDAQHKKNIADKKNRSAVIGPGLSHVPVVAGSAAAPVPEKETEEEKTARAALEEARKKREAELEGKVRESEEALKKEKARIAEIEERAKFHETERKNAEARAAAALEASRKESLERRQKEEEARAERAAKEAAAARLSETDKDRALKDAAARAAEQKVVEAQAEIKRKKQEGVALQAQINQAVKVVADLQAKVNAGQTEKMAALEEAKKRELALQGEKEALAREQAASTAKLGEAQKRAEEAEKKMNLYYEEGVKVTAAMKAHQAEAAALKTESEKLKADLARLDAEKKALESRPTREELEAAQQEHQRLAEEKRQKEAELQQLRQEAEAKQRAYDYEREQQRQAHEASLGGAQQSAEHKMGALTNEAQTAITKIATEKQQLAEQLQEAQSRSAQLEQWLLGHQQELEKYRQYIAAMNARVATPAPAAAQPPPIVEEMPAQPQAPDAEMADQPAPVPAAAAAGPTLLNAGKYGKPGKLGTRLAGAIKNDLLAAARNSGSFKTQDSPHVIKDLTKLLQKNDPEKQAAILAASGIRKGGVANVIKNINLAHPELDFDENTDETAASQAETVYRTAFYAANEIARQAKATSRLPSPDWNAARVEELVRGMQADENVNKLPTARLRDIAQTAFHQALSSYYSGLPKPSVGAELEAKRKLKDAFYNDWVRKSLEPLSGHSGVGKKAGALKVNIHHPGGVSNAGH